MWTIVGGLARLMGGMEMCKGVGLRLSGMFCLDGCRDQIFIWLEGAIEKKV